MIRISQIKCLDSSEIEALILKKLNMKPEDLLSWTIHRKSVDARHQKVCFSYIIDAKVRNEKKYLRHKDVKLTPDETYHPVTPGTRTLHHRPIIAGMGPAGMFAGLLLAKSGYKPIILERGSEVYARKKVVDDFWEGGVLDAECNVQFGEGGAGAFSDGKLTTRSKDSRCHMILEELVRHGADADILIDAYPHVGSDVFLKIIESIRKEIISLGGKIHFDTKVEDIEIKDNHITKVITNNGTFDTDTLILAIGHSAVDTILMLKEKGMEMTSKPFAVGVRIEHHQSFINEAMLKEFADDPRFVPARYQVSMTASNNKGAYSFCMCPGGYVVDASSKQGNLVVNGMSYSKRDGINANAAILIQVNSSDYGDGILDGLKYQEDLEKRAFSFANDFKAPVQLAKDYLNHKVSTSFGKVKPTYPRGTVFVDLNELFDENVNKALHEGLEYFERKIPGFVSDDALMTAVESRSSAAVRLTRNDALESSICGIYPCGEGSGYAGGIMTSAIDGIRVAESLISSFDKPK